jgi:hypothetical protein
MRRKRGWFLFTCMFDWPLCISSSGSSRMKRSISLWRCAQICLSYTAVRTNNELTASRKDLRRRPNEERSQYACERSDFAVLATTKRTPLYALPWFRFLISRGIDKQVTRPSYKLAVCLLSVRSRQQVHPHHTYCAMGSRVTLFLLYPQILWRFWSQLIFFAVRFTFEWS